MFFYNYRKKYSSKFGMIPAGWQIHHINGNRWDNRFSNLVALPGFLHGEFHSYFYKVRPNILQWLQRVTDKQQFKKAATQQARFIQCVELIAEFYYLRGKAGLAVKHWNQIKNNFYKGV
jgi:hypothetical protein